MEDFILFNFKKIILKKIKIMHNFYRLKKRKEREREKKERKGKKLCHFSLRWCT